jgi:hypothetical protein
MIIEPGMHEAPALPTSPVRVSTATMENVSCDTRILVETIIKKRSVSRIF